MAHRLTNNGSSWMYQQPSMRDPSASSYSEQTYQQGMSQNQADDPWNWGWDESNGSGESSNNNSQGDPKWDWSSDGGAGYQDQPLPGANAHYSQESSGHQIWSNQFPHHPVYTHEVPKTLEVINDSSTTSSVVNQPSYDQNQTIFNSMGRNNNLTHGYLTTEHQQHLFYTYINQSEELQHFPTEPSNENQQYFSGFHQHKNILGQDKLQNNMLLNCEGDSSNMAPHTAPEQTFSSCNESGKTPKSEVIRLAAVTDVARSGVCGLEAISPQWSTESLPSQGSDKSSHTTEDSVNNMQTALTKDTSAQVKLMSECIESDQKILNEQPSNLSLSLSQDPHQSQSYLPSVSALEGSIHESSSGIPSSVCDPSELSIRNIQGNVRLESRSKAPETSLVLVDNISEKLQSITLNVIENIEIAPPEPLEKRDMSCASSVSGSLPPLLCAPITAGANSNPYGVKGASLTPHKYASKHHTMRKASDEKSEDDITYSKHLLLVSNSQTEDVVSEEPTKDIISPPSPGAGVINKSSWGLVHSAEESVNLETVPDNKERPDVDLLREGKSSGAAGLKFHVFEQNPTQIHPSQHWLQEAGEPDNQEVYSDIPTVCPPDSSVKENSMFGSDSSNRNGCQWHQTPASAVLLSDLDRIIPGQGEDSRNVTQFLMPISNPVEDIGQRQVPGHQEDASDNAPASSQQSDTLEDISSRAVPGGLISGEDAVSPSSPPPAVASMYLQRSVPGQNSDFQMQVSTHTDISIVQGEDDIPPPGLSRMVPGESRGPEDHGPNGLTLQIALDEPRVVTGLAQDASLASGIAETTPSDAFQPLPDEPRVVTGVAQDELDNDLGAAISPVSTSSLPSDDPETIDLMAEGSTPILTQLPSERSETIGSDCVESFSTVPPDTMSRRDADHQQRSADELDNSSDIGRHGSVRDYFSSRERELSHDSEGRRYLDERENRLYDVEEHLYERHDHDETKSPRGRQNPHNRDRAKYDDNQRRHYEELSRQGRRYQKMNDDTDAEEYVSDRDMDGEQKHHKHDRERMHTEKMWYRNDDYNRYHNRKTRDTSSDFRVHNYDRYDRSRYAYDREYHRHEDYYGSYEDYFGHRSRPSSTSGLRPEYDDNRRRDYQHYGGYYYNPSMAYNYYWAWHQYVQQQQQLQPHVSGHGPGLPEDRGSVHSGRSSTHEELTHHNLDRSTEHNVSMLNETALSATPQRFTPAKFSVAHVKGVLTNHGKLVKILPHYPLDGQPAAVDICSVDQLLVPNPELKQFPGPLIKGVTHKKSLMNLCVRKIKEVEEDTNILEQDSLILLWRLLLLLLRQNGTVVGTDIAELLLSNPRADSVGSGNLTSVPHMTSGFPAQTISPEISVSGIDGEETPALVMNVRSKDLSEEDLTDNFREYLLYGNTQEALEWAMKHGLWGHALFLASKMDNRTYATVMTRFANGLTLNDPLQTLYQLMSGRLPAAVTCCSDVRWGDWRPHLAMILSNSAMQPDLEHRSIITLGDTLASRGCFYASQFCYLMAQLEFGFYNQKSTKLVLLGSSHTKPFCQFANNEAIQMTEIYVYACQLADPEFELPQFQAYKLLYAQRLLEAGMIVEALQYVETIARTITTRPSVYSPDFMQQVLELGNQLKVHDLSYSANSFEELEDLPWLLHLRSVIDDFTSGAIQTDGPSYGSTSNLSLSEGESLQPQVNQSVWAEEQMQQSKLNYQQQQQPQAEQDNQSVSYNTNIVDNSQVELDSGILGFHTNSNQQAVSSSWHPGELNSDISAAQNNFQNDQVSQHYWPSNQWEIVTHQKQEQALLSQDVSLGYNHTANGIVDSRQEEQMSHTNNDFCGQDQPNNAPLERSTGEPPILLPDPSLHQPASKLRPAVPAKPKSKKESSTKMTSAPSRSWFGGLWNKLALRPKNQMILPEDKEPKIVWSAEKHRWINTEANENEDDVDIPPPPKASQTPNNNAHISTSVISNGDVNVPPPNSQNVYKMNRMRGSRANYVDVFGGVKSNATSIPAPNIFPSIGASAVMPSNLFTPAPVKSDESAPIDFLTISSAIAADNRAGGEFSEGSTLQFKRSSLNPRGPTNAF